MPEAEDKNGAMFGLDRMIAALNEVPNAAPEQTLRHVRKAVGDFVGDAEQFDDMTMLCFEYRGGKRESGGGTQTAGASRDPRGNTQEIN